ncbi:MAG TPA: ribulose-phosphate 3-epimerase [Solirubrobacteraceae bacterium]|jgi:ribulose-phosphate 3-epimerase|nr:ribulose-phosphate 3-epimerase [Solirubrobacteraceae bacterium]
MSRPLSEPLSGVRVAPSILSADFGRLREQVEEVLNAGARVIHVDVMDGHFVPPITVGPIVVAALREQTHAADAVLDVHLMIERPERHVGEFVKAGADTVTFHAEATPHVSYTAGLLREQGVGVGVAINPATPVGALAEVTGAIDMALCMTVNPGWGGQPFIAHSPEKIERVRAIVGADVAVQVDGGIDRETAPACRAVGANVFVAGSAIFGSDDPGEAYRAIARAVDAA